MILGADHYKTNADLMLACFELGYLDPDIDILDPTFGKGTWWKGMDVGIWPHDLYVGDGVDFRHLPHEDDTFVQAVFDPPYVAVGGRKTSTVSNFNETYGLGEVPRTPKGLHTLMVAGLAELHRVVENKGMVLFKCMNYVTSGNYKTQAYDALEAARGLGFVLHDELIMLRNPGPQPARKKQLHARRNYSHLFVLQVRK